MESQTCKQCGEKAKILLPYGPHAFCAEHFNAYFENRIRKTIRENELLKRNEKILMALSGGKDSMVLLHVLHKYYARTNSLHALLIDEGIAGYRENAIALAVQACDARSVPYTIVSHQEEFGFTNNQIAPVIFATPELGKSVCSYCGTFRKTLMNRYAKKLGADKLATGHNLDDEAQSVLMNVFDNHAAKMASLGPMANNLSEDYVVPRIKPLYETPEKDIIAFASQNQIPHYSDECCPYSFKAKRNDFRAMLNNFEQKYPGTKHSVIRFLEDIKPQVPQSGTLKTLHACTECDEPTPHALCQACGKKGILQKALETRKNTARIEISAPSDAISCNTTKQM